jgi:hypothetical protein
VEQGNDDLVFWGERLEQCAKEFATFVWGRVFWGLLQKGFCGVLSVLWEVTPAVFGATGFGAKGVQADVQAEAGDPVFEGSCGFVAVEVFEELDEDVLNEVLCGGASGEMIGNDATDLGVECFDEPRGGGFVPRGLPCDEVVLEGRKHGGGEVRVRYTEECTW